MAGYLALAPDVFARDGVRPAPLEKARLAESVGFINELPPASILDATKREQALAKRPEDQQTRIRESLGALFGTLGDAARNLQPVLGAVSHLRSLETSGVAAMGFCMGGGLSGLAACRDPELKAAVIFYGNAPPEDQIEHIRCPVLAFHGSEDKRLVDGLPGFEAAMKRHGKSLEVHVYENAQHAFFNDTRPSYQARATRLALARMLAFLVEAMG
jgi:carboxymethylenebutenolidase